MTLRIDGVGVQDPDANASVGDDDNHNAFVGPDALIRLQNNEQLTLEGIVLSGFDDMTFNGTVNAQGWVQLSGVDAAGAPSGAIISARLRYVEEGSTARAVSSDPSDPYAPITPAVPPSNEIWFDYESGSVKDTIRLVGVGGQAIPWSDRTEVAARNFMQQANRGDMAALTMMVFGDRVDALTETINAMMRDVDARSAAMKRLNERVAGAQEQLVGVEEAIAHLEALKSNYQTFGNDRVGTHWTGGDGADYAGAAAYAALGRALYGRAITSGEKATLDGSTDFDGTIAKVKAYQKLRTDEIDTSQKALQAASTVQSDTLAKLQKLNNDQSDANGIRVALLTNWYNMMQKIIDAMNR